MNRIAAAGLSLLLVAATAGGALAAPAMSGSSNPGRMTATASGAYMNADTARLDRGGNGYTMALNTLEADGYTGIQNFERSANSFTATAMHDGRRVKVAVDSSGHVTPRS